MVAYKLATVLHKALYWTPQGSRFWLHSPLTWGRPRCNHTVKACGFRGLCTGNQRTAGVWKCFFFSCFFLMSLNSWVKQVTVCSPQWPLDDRATLWALRCLISPCRALQKGPSSIKVKTNDWKEDAESLCVRGRLLCGQVNLHQAQKWIQEASLWFKLRFF